MKRKHYIMQLVLLAATVAIVVVSARNLPAGFNRDIQNISVEIDGTNFGKFSKISGLESAVGAPSPSTNDHFRITFHRDFVTDPSLYLWAKQNVNERQGLRNIHVVRRNEHGDEVARYVLKLCQPLSWTVEAANPALGGFHETVELAVQDIAIY